MSLLCQRGALGSDVIKSSSQRHQNLVCAGGPGAQQHSQAANPCVMPGQTHTGNRHKHFLLGSGGSRGKGRFLLTPPPPSPCLTWHFLIKALNLEGRGRMSRPGRQKLRPFSVAYTCLFILSKFRCLWKKCSEPSSCGLRGLPRVDLGVDSDSFCLVSICV